MKILVIEDDEVIAERIKTGLEDANYIVRVAHDGSEGLEMAMSEWYALVILDLMLPGKDGWSVCEALRRKRSTVPILMLTARDGVTDRVRGLDAGADDYLPQPTGILKTAATRLNRRRSVRETRKLRHDIMPSKVTPLKNF